MDKKYKFQLFKYTLSDKKLTKRNVHFYVYEMKCNVRREILNFKYKNYA